MSRAKAAEKARTGFRILNQETKTVPIDSIQPHPQNVHEAQAAPLAESITANGFYGSVIVQVSTRFIIVGSHRWREAKQAGATEIPATFIDVDDTAAIRIMLADNRTGQLGSDNTDALAGLLENFDDLIGTGFSDGDLAALLSETNKTAFSDVGDDADKASSGTKSKRNLGDPKVQIKPVIYSQQVEIFERAMKSTKEPNRGKALVKICESYLEAIDGEDGGVL